MVALPEEVADHPAGVMAAVDTVRRRLAGAFLIDPWGLDAEVLGLAARAVGVRWSVSIGGLPHLPLDGPVLLVANQRPVSVAPQAAALALGQAVGRPIRFVGVLDVPPLATFGYRLGGLLDRPEEVAGVLRSGGVALVWCAARLRSGARVGPVTPAHLKTALDAGAPVVPVAIHGRRLGRLLRIEVGPAVAPRRRAGPLAPVELADAAREAVQGLLDEATPPRWPYR